MNDTSFTETEYIPETCVDASIRISKRTILIPEGALERLLQGHQDE